MKARPPSAGASMSARTIRRAPTWPTTRKRKRYCSGKRRGEGHVFSSSRCSSHPIIVKERAPVRESWETGRVVLHLECEYVAKATRPAAPALADGLKGATSGSGRYPPWWAMQTPGQETRTACKGRRGPFDTRSGERALAPAIFTYPRLFTAARRRSAAFPRIFGGACFGRRTRSVRPDAA